MGTKIRLPRGVKVHEANGLDYGLPSWLSERDTLIERAEKRLGDIEELAPGEFRVMGSQRLSDDFDSYDVRKVAGKWECSCEGHQYGGARRGRCSHIVACRIFDVTRPVQFVEPGEVGEDRASVQFVSLDEIARMYRPQFVEASRFAPVEFVQAKPVVEWLHELDPERELVPVDSGQEVEVLPDFGDGEDLWLRLASDVFGFEYEVEEPDAVPDEAAEVVAEVVEVAPWEVPLPKCKPIAELVLPSWCKGLRTQQVWAIEKVCAAFESGKKHVILEAPVGFGKTLAASLVAQALNVRSLYVCTDKNLQRQYCGDFEEAEILTGKGNYRPADAPHKTCGDCDYKKGKGCTLCRPANPALPFTSKQRCPYWIAKKRAQAADVAVLNTAYVLSVFNFHAAGADNVHGFWGFVPGGHSFGFANRGLAIYDEAHELEGALMDFAQISLGPQLLKFFGAVPPNKNSRWSKRIVWLNELLEKILHFIKAVTPEAADALDGDEDDEEEDKFLKSCVQSAFKIGNLLVDLEGLDKDPEERRESWVYEPGEDTVSFKPVRVHKYGMPMLFGHSKLNLLMSGTILMPQQYAESLGLDWDDCAFVQVDSAFPVERRPIFVWPVAPMTYKEKAKALPLMRERILRTRMDYPGRMLVHTVSYDLNRDLADFLRANGVRCYTHGQGGEEKERALNMLRRGPPDGALLSPSSHTGVDLPGDECRIVVIPKVPYPSLKDDQVSRRMWQPNKLAGEQWYQCEAMRKVLQMAGRGMRSADDWCRIFVYDQLFLKLFREVKPFLLPGFTQSLVFEMRPGADPLLKIQMPDGEHLPLKLRP